MTDEITVSARGVGKKYQLGQFQHGYGLLSEVIADRLKRMRRPRPRGRPDFWALKEVGFEVRRGETFGIIGHNGAGKSTLLKILSRVTPPTAGEITLQGRVGSLLEVGTGFHGELTGRENIYLNGAILGMHKSEIDAKFDEIVSFAEVEHFVDTPVKRYSSGMYLRLAFAVAAHLEPEILIIDEVLSVGDLTFQEKCLGRMEEVAGQGRTVLFVSHNLSAVRSLCERSMLLTSGEKIIEGPTQEVIDSYVRSVRVQAGVELHQRTDRHGSGRLRFKSVRLETQGEVIDSPSTGETFEFVIGYEVERGTRRLRDANFAIQIMTVLGEVLLHLYSDTAGAMLGELPDSGELRCQLPRCPLPAGQYVVTLWSDLGGQPLDWIERAFELTVREGDFYSSGRSQLASHRSVLVDHSWTVNSDDEAVRHEPLAPSTTH